MNSRLACFLLSAGAALASPPPVSAATDAIIPAVHVRHDGEGRVSFAGRTVVRVPADASADLRALAADFATELAEVTGRPWRVSTESGEGLVFAPMPSGGKFLPETYRLETTGKGARLTAGDQRGFAWASRVVLQLLMQAPDKISLPAGEIDDAPEYRHRIFMLDVGRKPTPLPVLRDYIRMMAWNRLNELHLHLSDESSRGLYAAFRVRSDKFPGLAAKDLSYSKEELRALQDFARVHGVVITPEFDMPGHARCFTNFRPDLTLKVRGKTYENYVDVTKPETVTFLKDVLTEMAPLFDGPDIHIGTDEYRVGNEPALHEAFRVFINTMNAHVRSLGKTTRIWSGFEHMKGTTEIDPSITVDMWETDDAKGRIAKGNKVINSNHGRTYIVPGAHYYGVSNAGIYNGWEPWMVSGDMAKNPVKGDPALLGGALHVWCDQGPTGYTHNEIVRLAFPSFQVFGEKLWGVKGFSDYNAFRPAAETLAAVPLVRTTERIARAGDKPVLDLPGEITLGSPADSRPTPFADAERDSLEWDWTLSFDVMPAARTGKRAVLLSSRYAEIALDYPRNYEKKHKEKDAKTGKEREVKTKETRSGIAVIRAAGFMPEGAAPTDSKYVNDVSQVYAPFPEPGRWHTVVIVGKKGRTEVYVDGKLSSAQNEQTVCPLGRIGDTFGESFVGKIRNLKVLPVAAPPAGAK